MGLKKQTKNPTVNNSNICTGANTSKHFSACLLHIFLSLIVTGYCSLLVGHSDEQKIEDFKQHVCCAANILFFVLFLGLFVFFLPSPSVTVWSALIGQDLNCHMTMFSKFLCMPELLFKAFCLFYWWTVYLRHDPCDDKDFNNKDSLPGGPAGSIGRSNPHVNFFFSVFFPNMKLIFAVFSSGYCWMYFSCHFKCRVVLFEVVQIKSCVGWSPGSCWGGANYLSELHFSSGEVTRWWAPLDPKTKRSVF